MLAAAGYGVRGDAAVTAPAVGLWNDVGALTTCDQNSGPTPTPPSAPSPATCAGRAAVLIEGPRCRVLPTPAYCGNLLVVGAGAQVASESDAQAAEKYDPATGQWSNAGPMGHLRVGPGAVQIDGPECATSRMPVRCGQILVVGGNSNEHPDSAELYDPATNRWAPASDLNAFHYTAFGIVVLQGPNCGSLCGDVLVAGGAGGVHSSISGGAKVAEVFDPRDGTWTPTGALNTPRTGHITVVLDGPECAGGSPPRHCGEVLVAGGQSPSPSDPGTTSAELFDPMAIDPVTGAPGAWGPTGALKPGGMGLYAPARATATVLSGSRCAAQCGEVLVAGGYLFKGPPSAYFPYGDGNYDTAELYRPLTHDWVVAPRMQAVRAFHVGVLLPSGEYLVAGGAGAGASSAPQATAELYDPAAVPPAWSPAHAMNRARASFVAAFLAAGTAASCAPISGCTLVVGGQGAPDDNVAELFQAPPTIASLNPGCGPSSGATAITIAGDAFTPGTQVMFGGSAVASTFAPDGTIHITAPVTTGTTSVPVTVQNTAGISQAATFVSPCPPPPPSPPPSGTNGVVSQGPAGPPAVVHPGAPLPHALPAHPQPPALPQPHAAPQPPAAAQAAPVAPQAPAAGSAPGAAPAPPAGTAGVVGHPTGASAGVGVGVDGEGEVSPAPRHAMVRRDDLEVSPALQAAGTGMLVVFAGSLVATRPRRRRRLAADQASVTRQASAPMHRRAVTELREPW